MEFQKIGKLSRRKMKSKNSLRKCMTFFSSFTTKKEKHIYTYTHLESNKDKDLISTPPPPSHKKNNQRDQREKTKVISSSRFLQNSRVKKNFINYPIPGRNFHRILLSPPFAVIKLALSSTRSLPALLSFFFPLLISSQ